MSDQEEPWEPDPEREEALKQLASWCLALITMRANTPPGEWFNEAFEKVYADGWKEATEVLGDEANEYALLDMMNMAELLLSWLSQFSRKPTSEWLALLRETYIDEVPNDGC